MPTKPPPRIHVLIARKARKAVVFRRGPSKQTLMLTWDLERDRLKPGQWLKSRVYEHRCDLSPSGEFVLIFAGRHAGPVATWSAISRPPWFTALVAYKNHFGAWGGGGLFDTEHTLRINHGSELQPLPGAVQPNRFRPTLLGQGLGEDDPVRHLRLTRDGWELTERGVSKDHSISSPVWIEYTTPKVYERRHPRRTNVRLQQRLLGIKEKNGAWYLFEHDVVDDGGHRIPLGRTDWADWDHNGDLLFAKDGCLYRAKLKPKGLVLDGPELVEDLAPYTFEAVEAPRSALK